MSFIGNSNRVGHTANAAGSRRQNQIQRGEATRSGRRPDPSSLRRTPSRKHGTLRGTINAAIDRNVLERPKVREQLSELHPNTRFRSRDLRRITKDMMAEIQKRSVAGRPIAEVEQIVTMSPEEFEHWKTSGITLQHWNDFKDVAREQGFIFVRKVNELSTGLIEQGYGTKKLDIHSKSADWGPQAGFIPVDQSLSKKVGNQAAVEKGSMQAQESLKEDHIGAAHLEIPISRVAELVERGILPDTVLTGSKEHPRLNGNGEFVAEKDGLQTHFKLEASTADQFLVFYQKPDSEEWLPLQVLGYVDQEHLQPKLSLTQKEKVTTPVTADYDLFATCPHNSELDAAKYQKEDGINGRGQLGFLSEHDEQTMDKLNQKMGGLPKVNHGPDTGNPFPEHEDEYVMFTPSGNARMVPAEQMPQIFRDIHSGGHVTPHNKHWVKTPKERTALTNKAKEEAWPKAAEEQQTQPSALKSKRLKPRAKARRQPKANKAGQHRKATLPKQKPIELIYDKMGYDGKARLHGLELKILSRDDFDENREQILSQLSKREVLDKFHQTQMDLIEGSRRRGSSDVLDMDLAPSSHKNTSQSGNP